MARGDGPSWLLGLGKSATFKPKMWLLEPWREALAMADNVAGLAIIYCVVLSLDWDLLHRTEAQSAKMLKYDCSA